MMNLEQINLAQKIIGLRKTSLYATKNSLDISEADSQVAIEMIGRGWIVYNKTLYLTAEGLDQLRLQISEFRFKEQS